MSCKLQDVLRYKQGYNFFTIRHNFGYEQDFILRLRMDINPHALTSFSTSTPLVSCSGTKDVLKCKLRLVNIELGGGGWVGGGRGGATVVHKTPIAIRAR